MAKTENLGERTKKKKSDFRARKKENLEKVSSDSMPSEGEKPEKERAHAKICRPRIPKTQKPSTIHKKREKDLTERELSWFPLCYVFCFSCRYSKIVPHSQPTLSFSIQELSLPSLHSTWRCSPQRKLRETGRTRNR